MHRHMSVEFGINVVAKWSRALPCYDAVKVTWLDVNELRKERELKPYQGKREQGRS